MAAPTGRKTGLSYPDRNKTRLYFGFILKVQTVQKQNESDGKANELNRPLVFTKKTSVSFGVGDDLGDHVPGVLNARARLRPAGPRVRPDQEEHPVLDLGQSQGIEQVRDAAGAREVLESNQRTPRSR